MSIVGYVGNATAGATIAHGLSQAPDLIIAKDRTSDYAWKVGSSSMDSASPWYYWMQLDDSEPAVNGSADIWNDSAPSASVFTIGDHVTINTDTDNFIAYCFHSVEGYSKIGSYEGSGDADGAFVYTGFQVAYLLVKSIDGTYDWYQTDNKVTPINVRDNVLYPDLTAASGSSWPWVDFLSNGFKIRTDPTSGAVNSNSLMYYAIASTPFKTSNAV
jgi:hypothetical protein